MLFVLVFQLQRYAKKLDLQIFLDKNIVFSAYLFVFTSLRPYFSLYSTPNRRREASKRIAMNSNNVKAINDDPP